MLSCLDVLSKPSNDVEVLQTKWARRLRSLRKFRSERIPSAKPNGIPAFGPVGILNTGPIDSSIDFDGKRYLERIHQIYLNEPWWTTNWGYRNNMARLGVILFKKKHLHEKPRRENSCTCVFSPGPPRCGPILARPGSRKKTTTKTKTKTSQLLHRGRRRSHAATNVSAAPRRIRSSANGVRSPPTGRWRNLYKVKQFAK